MQLQTSPLPAPVPVSDLQPDPSVSDSALDQISLRDTTPTPNGNAHLPTPPSSEPDQPKPLDLRHIFAIGDCAETGAIQAGHTAYWQAEVAARNLCRLIERQEGRNKEGLESYKPGLPCIKLTLGLVSPFVSSFSLLQTVSPSSSS